MMNTLLKLSLNNRLVVIAISIFLCLYGLWTSTRLPIDVFPDLDRPRVAVMTEAGGLAPEEVESQVTLPLEVALNGANGVQVVRSSSSTGMSIIYVEFDFGTNIYTARQIIAERLSEVGGRLPEGMKPQLAPISSVMGQIMVLAMWTENEGVSPMHLRTEADWILRTRLLSIPGVAQVFTMGGERKQFQVLVDQEALTRHGLTIDTVEKAVLESNSNATGGYIDKRGPNEWLVRAIGRIQSIKDIEDIPLDNGDGRPVPLSMIAKIIEGPQIKRGDASAFLRNSSKGDGAGEGAGKGGAGKTFTGGPCVVLTVSKQPGADTRSVSRSIHAAVQETLPALSKGVRVEALYSQEHFIERAIENVLEALRDGGILVVIILFLFLMNFRTTFISLTAIPISLLATVVVFRAFGMSINTMTLGGLAVAIGELVDDAIVDVENIFRRLKENKALDSPKHPLRIVYEASLEVRGSIVYSTIIVCMVFLPLFALSGMEGRLFAPLGIAYVVSIIASLVVSLTVTPILSYWLLPNSSAVSHSEDSMVLRVLKGGADRIIRFSLDYPWLNLGAVAIMVIVSVVAIWNRERDFLPPFNEGAVQINVLLPPGTSLATSVAINQKVEDSLKMEEDVINFVRRTGRAELDEHAEPVSASEYIVDLNPNSSRSREEQLRSIRERIEDVPGVVFAVEQPISHLISHMLSGVKAQIGIKLYGDDLDVLRKKASEVQGIVSNVPGVVDLVVEQQVLIPQLRIEYDREKLLSFGLSVEKVNGYLETSLNGKVVSEVLDGQRTFDLLVRLDDSIRQDMEAIKRLPVPVPTGGTVPMESIAKVYDSLGPNVIQREKIKRRIIVQCNVDDRGVVDVADEIKAKLADVPLPGGYYFEYSGQFESQRSASRIIFWLFLAAMLGVFLTLYTMFRSSNLALQVMTAIPMAFIGSVVALLITDQTLTIANIVGFISLGGIASRNGILLIQHYIHLVKYEGETWSKEMIVRAGKERLAPVLMTALTAGIGLVPLVLVAGQPGKEILYPVATIILGGVISSTLLDFFVHPALFWLFGIRSAERALNESKSSPLLEG